MKLSLKAGCVPSVVAFTLVLTALSGARAIAAETYVLNKGHTDIRVYWNHAGVSDQSGRFNAFDGELVLDEEDISKSSLDVTIKVDSISTGVPALDADLKSKNYFDVQTYPEITFKSTAVKQTSLSTADITGDLTIHGVTKPVTVNVKLVHKGEHPLGQFLDAYKGKWVGFTAETALLRSEFNVAKAIPIVSDRIVIRINTELQPKP